DRQNGRVEDAGWIGIEENGRNLLEFDRDLARALRQPLAGAQEKRRSRPTPVVDEELQRDESFGLRLRIDALFLAVPGHRSAHVESGRVLRADDMRVDGRGLDRP